MNYNEYEPLDEEEDRENNTGFTTVALNEF